LPDLGGSHALATDLNRRGIVIGNSQDADGAVKAVWWDRARRVHVIETGSGLADTARDINDAGAIVGNADDLELGRPHAWYRSPGGRVSFLPVPAGAVSSAAEHINQHGVIAGSISFADESVAAALWSSPTAAPTLLPGTAGHPEGVSFGIDDRGTAVGGVVDASGVTAPVYWPSHRPPVLLRVRGATTPGVARAINGRGQIAGTATAPGDSREQAVRWDRDGTARLLGWLPGGTRSEALAISRHGRVAGWSDDGTGTTHAVVSTGTGPLRALPGLAAAMDARANAVDDRGTVVGSAGQDPLTIRAVMWHCVFGR
jgi:uncharacterized membrane protein